MISVHFGIRRSGGQSPAELGNSHRAYVEAMRAAQAAHARALSSGDEPAPTLRLDSWLRACVGRIRFP